MILIIFVLMLVIAFLLFAIYELLQRCEDAEKIIKTLLNENKIYGDINTILLTTLGAIEVDVVNLETHNKNGPEVEDMRKIIDECNIKVNKYFNSRK